MTTVYHKRDGQILAVLKEPDADYELAQRMAGVEVQRFETDEVKGADEARVACETGRVHAGKVTFGPGGGVEAAVRAISMEEIRAAVRAELAAERARGGRDS